MPLIFQLPPSPRKSDVRWSHKMFKEIFSLLLHLGLPSISFALCQDTCGVNSWLQKSSRTVWLLDIKATSELSATRVRIRRAAHLHSSFFTKGQMCTLIRKSPWSLRVSISIWHSFLSHYRCRNFDQNIIAIPVTRHKGWPPISLINVVGASVFLPCLFWYFSKVTVLVC